MCNARGRYSDELSAIFDSPDYQGLENENEQHEYVTLNILKTRIEAGGWVETNPRFYLSGTREGKHMLCPTRLVGSYEAVKKAISRAIKQLKRFAAEKARRDEAEREAEELKEKRRNLLTRLHEDFGFIEPIDERWDIKVIKRKFGSLLHEAQNDARGRQIVTAFAIAHQFYNPWLVVIYDFYFDLTGDAFDALKKIVNLKVEETEECKAYRTEFGPQQGRVGQMCKSLFLRTLRSR